jgi:hypothetical protein
MDVYGKTVKVSLKEVKHDGAEWLQIDTSGVLLGML